MVTYLKSWPVVRVHGTDVQTWNIHRIIQPTSRSGPGVKGEGKGSIRFIYEVGDTVQLTSSPSHIVLPHQLQQGILCHPHLGFSIPLSHYLAIPKHPHHTLPFLTPPPLLFHSTFKTLTPIFNYLPDVPLTCKIATCRFCSAILRPMHALGPWPKGSTR